MLLAIQAQVYGCPAVSERLTYQQTNFERVNPRLKLISRLYCWYLDLIGFFLPNTVGMHILEIPVPATLESGCSLTVSVKR